MGGIRVTDQDRAAAGPRPSASPEVADARTLRILDFPAVLEQLAKRCASDLGAAAARALTPSGRARQVASDLEETAEARALLLAAARPPLDGLQDVGALVGRAARGGLLGGAELWRVGQTAGCLGALAAHLDAHAALAPRLADWATAIADFAPVRTEVARCIGPEGEVLDRASPALAAARQEARRLEAALRDRLEELVRNPALQGALQEPLVTQRRDRFVLPVRSEARSQLPGLIHDQSASGATVFIEPLAVVETGNRWRAAQARVAAEEARILTELSALAGRDARAWQRSLAVGGHLDLATAKGLLAETWAACAPELLPHPALDLSQARHPLLARPVPIDLRLGQDFDALVLTGPNTGGKTVSLKIAGLFACLCQAGLHLPAATARLGIFPRVCGDAGDDQGVVQSLSTFSSHMRAVVAAVEATVPGALVLLDELGAGTDPGEGAALAMAVLEHLVTAGARVLVTTHYSELKAFAHREPRFENGSVSFDSETLAPTYHLMIGVPGPSQAFAIAERLGLDADVVERARALQRPEQRHVEQLIAGMAADERRLHEAADAAEAQRRQADALAAELERARTELEIEREAVLAEARRDAAAATAAARREADAVVRELRRLAERAAAEGALAEAEAQRERLRAVSAAVPAAAPVPRAWHAGQPVRIVSLGQDGVLMAAPSGDDALVQAGGLRLHVPLDDLRPAAAPLPAAKAPRRGGGPMAAVLPQAAVECDLRGMRADAALARADKALDDAVLAGLTEIRLIHGKGTGVLRQVVAEFLRGHPQVAGFRLGGTGEGGDGATVVTLRA